MDCSGQMNTSSLPGNLSMESIMKENDNNEFTTGEKIFVSIWLFSVIALICMGIGFFIWYGLGLQEYCLDSSRIINFNSISKYDISLWKNEEIDDKEFEKRIRLVLNIPHLFYHNNREIKYYKVFDGDIKIDFNHSPQSMVLTVPNITKKNEVILTNYFENP